MHILFMFIDATQSSLFWVSSVTPSYFLLAPIPCNSRRMRHRYLDNSEYASPAVYTHAYVCLATCRFASFTVEPGNSSGGSGSQWNLDVVCQEISRIVCRCISIYLYLCPLV